MKAGKLRRRRFLQAGATAAAAAATVSCGGVKSPWRYLSPEQARTLEAMCEQIIPADRDPGAREAGVVHFIDRQLTGFHRQFRDAYRIGLPALNETSRQLHGAAFAEIPWDRQTAVLRSIESATAGGAHWQGTSPADFFSLVVAHTMQGFYGSPRHGGNREAASWRMLGVPDPPVRGQAQYDLTKKG